MQVVAVVGAAPGVGKSSLCASLSGWLTEAGRVVDHFEEEHVLARPAFARVAADFTTTGVVAADVLIDATTRYLTAADSAGVDVAVLDALVPFVPSLLAFGHSEREVVDIVRDLAVRIARVPVLVVFLGGDPVTALRRAAVREGPDWLRWYAGKLHRYGLVDGPEPDESRLAAYLARERATTMLALRETRWDLVVVEDAGEMSPDAVFRSVRDRITRFISRAG